MLTIKETKKPLAIVNEGKQKGTIVYYNENAPVRNSILKKKVDTEIISETGKFFPLPASGEMGERECVFIVGKSGAGKSFWICQYVKLYKKMFPKNEIYLFSNKPKDPILDNLDMQRINISRKLVEEPLLLNDPNPENEPIENCLFIFDDVDSFADKEVEAEILKLQNDIYMLGRDKKISMLHSKHVGLDSKKSSVALSEMSGLVFFMKGTNPHVIKTVLSKYCDLDKEQISKYTKLESRWAYLHKAIPSYVVSEKKIYLL